MKGFFSHQVPLTVILLLNIPFVYFVPEDVNGG
jgi:hypothetical protein